MGSNLETLTEEQLVPGRIYIGGIKEVIGSIHEGLYGTYVYFGEYFGKYLWLRLDWLDTRERYGGVRKMITRCACAHQFELTDKIKNVYYPEYYKHVCAFQLSAMDMRSLRILGDVLL